MVKSEINFPFEIEKLKFCIFHRFFFLYTYFRSFFILAFQSRVPFDKMTQIEAACFPDMVAPLSSQKMFLNLRNRILQMWLENPKCQLTAQDALKRLQPPWNSDEDLVIRIHAFLERHGYVNFGIFKRTSAPPQKTGRVIVIGAGMFNLFSLKLRREI